MRASHIRRLGTLLAALAATAAGTLAAQGAGTPRRTDCLRPGSFMMGPIQLGMTGTVARASLRTPTATRAERVRIGDAVQRVTVLSFRGMDVGVSDATDRVVLLRAVGSYRSTPNRLRIGQTRAQARAIMPREALPETGPDSLEIASCDAGLGSMRLVFEADTLRRLELSGPGRGGTEGQR